MRGAPDAREEPANAALLVGIVRASDGCIGAAPCRSHEVTGSGREDSVSTERERRKQKKAEKKRVHAKAEQKARRVRAQAPKEKATAAGADWSLGLAWASENWVEQGAQVVAVLSTNVAFSTNSTLGRTP